MIKLKKNLLFISLLLILFISLGAVSAADMSVNDISSFDNTRNVGFVQEDLGQKDVESISLQEAPAPLSDLGKEIVAAESGATIILTKDYKSDHSGDNIVISKSLTIDGQGHTIEGSDSTRLFKIFGDNVILKNITFINTIYFHGGAIYCSGANCSVVNCSFVNCSSTEGGGAIYWEGTNCSVVNCSFVNSTSLHGGAIYLDSNECLVSGCNFTNCSSDNEGGAIYGIGNKNTVSGCNFSNCKAIQYAGAIYWAGNESLVSNSSFVKCSANSGGAIQWMESLYSSILGCSFVNCSAVSSSAIDWNAANGVINYNIFDNNVAKSFGNVINTKNAIDCNYNFFAFENNVTSFPDGLVGGSTVNNWVVLDISKDNGKYSVDFVCNDGSTLTKYMYDYLAKLNIDENVKEITIKNNTFKDTPISGDYLLTSHNSANILARSSLNWDTIVDLTIEDIMYGDVAVVNGTVSAIDGYVPKGNVALFVDGVKNCTLPINEGKFRTRLYDLGAGVYNITVVYNGDGNYLASNASTNLTVHSLKGSFDIEVKDIVYGDGFVINITDAVGVNGEKLSGVAKVRINGTDYDVVVSDGSGFKVVNDTLFGGKYFVDASLSVPNYDVMYSDTNFVVSRASSVVSVGVGDIVYGDVAVVNGTVGGLVGKSIPSGNVTLFVDGVENVTVSVKDGGFSADLYDLGAGVYNISVVYNGDGNYLSSNVSANLIVLNASGIFIVGVEDIVYGDGFIINITNATGVNGTLLNGIVDVTVDGNVYSFNVTDGAGSKEVYDILSAGKYVVSASLSVPNYNVMIANTSFSVAKVPTKFVDVTNATVYNGKFYSFRLVDNSGNALASKNVTIKIAGKTYNVTTDKNGLAKVKLDLTSKYLNKSLTVTYKFTGDNDFKESSGSSSIKVIKTATKITNATKLVVKNHKYFYVKLTTKSGKVLANKVIKMKSSVSGKTYKIKTNSKGIAKIDLWVKKQPLGKYYKYTFKYAGSKYYNSYTKTFKIKIIK